MTDKEKLIAIRAEIERLNANIEKLFLCNDVSIEYMQGFKNALAMLSKQIDSMQKEPKKCMYTKDDFTDEDRKVLCDGCEEDCEYSKKEPKMPKVFENMLNAITPAESLGISPEEHDKIVDECIFGKEPEMVDVDDSPKKEPVCNDFELALAEMIDKARKCIVEPWAIAAQWKDYLVELAKSEEPVSEELKDAASSFARKDSEGISNSANFYYTVADKARIFKSGAKWQIARLMKDAIDVTVHTDAGGYPYIPQIELYDYDKDVPLAKAGDKYNVILIKEK